MIYHTILNWPDSQSQLVPYLVDARPRPVVHPDDLGPGSSVAFFVQFGRRVDPDFTPERMMVRRVVQMVNRSIGVDDVVGPIHIPQGLPGYLG
jgi:hypothetical protein